ncbi:oligosaccharide flippase family protein [Roseospira navarrensis]|nr:oligosaccharide flippase family protein [Roseospira navarrensis]
MVRSTLVLLGGRTSEALLRFLRNVLLARLLGVEDYGIAGTFVLAASMVEVVSDLALERMVVQDREGNNPRFVSAIQTLVVIRSILIAGIVYLCGDLLALLFGFPELGWAYQLLAVVPLIRGFFHLDIMREQRGMRFGRQVLAEFLTVLGTLLLLWPLAAWIGDFRVILWIICIDAGVRTVFSHVLASERFRLGWDIPIFKRAILFGAPLLAANILMFLNTQGDRIIIANQFSAFELGVFTAAFTLFMTPVSTGANIMRQLFLPLIARERDNPVLFERRCSETLQANLVLGCAVMIGGALIGEPAFLLAFGQEFAAGLPWIVPLCVMFGARFASVGPVVVAVAGGRTINVTIRNAVRMAFVPVALGIAVSGGTILALIYIAAAGEVVAYGVGIALVRYRLALRKATNRMWLPAALAIAIASVVLSARMLPFDYWWIQVTATGLLVFLFASCVDFWTWMYRGASTRLKKKLA